ncbi:MAG: hypothetical protein HGA54_05105 [Actinobacteria bacterium]|nr:hypothetical protein [Actinomycetota bacterium]
MNEGVLQDLTREDLYKLIEMYSKNWMALDGVWFQSIERKFGMDEAMFHDAEAWKRYTVIEARRIKDFLDLPDQAGLEGLKKALSLRFVANVNKNESILTDNTLLFRVNECRVQIARARKGMEYHPCKPVGLIEYSEFARIIDERITCECLSCHPDVTDTSCSCSWLFTLGE